MVEIRATSDYNKTSKHKYTMLYIGDVAVSKFDVNNNDFRAKSGPVRKV